MSSNLLMLGLCELGNVDANASTQLLTLRFSSDDESDADMVGLELATRSDSI
jgi:predicted Zn-dependent protease